MSDERIRNAFGDLNRQASDADPEPSLAGLASSQVRRRSGSPRPRWIPAVAAAATVVVALGAVALLTRGPGGDEVAAPAGTDSTIATQPITDSPSDDGTVPDTMGTTDTTAPSAGTVVDPPQTTTTTDPLEGRDPVFVGEGWRVVGVAPDDVLNVRSGPGTQNEIVATFAPDETDVRLSGWGTTIADGNEWWGVLLPDGGEGWVNNVFLAAPESWTGDVRAEQCGLEETPDFGQDGPPEDLTDGPNALVGLAHVDGGDCDRYIFVLGDYGTEGTYTPVASFNAFGIEVSEVSDQELAVSLPENIVEAIPVATVDHIDQALVLATTPLFDAGSSQVSMRIFGSHDGYALTFRANPARVILDVFDSVSEGAAVIEGSGTFVLPVSLTGEGQVEFRGFARPFEAVGNIRVVPISGSVANIAFGGTSITFSDGPEAAFTASWWPSYGEFSGTITGLTAGSYEMWVYQSECLEGDTAGALARCGVAVPIEIP